MTNALALTQELIRLRSINPPGEEQACAFLVGRLLEEAGFSVVYHSHAEGRPSLVARLEGEGAPLCFTGHLDTVPLGSAAWNCDPFGADTDGDALYGRGSSDMKSGVAAMVLAAIRLAALPGRRAGLVLVITAGEETGCDGARYLAEVADALPRAGALVVGEPTSNYPLIGHKGALWLRAAFHGKTAHGSMPEKGDNAIYKAARSIQRLEHYRFNAQPHHHLGHSTLNVGTIRGGLNVNSVPDRVEVEIDVRTVPGQHNDEIRHELEALMEPGTATERMVDVGHVASNPADAWVQEVFAICGRTLGQTIEPRGATFFTDASVLTPAMGGIPSLVLGPGEAAMAHKTDEYCRIQRIDEAVEIYREIGRRWMGL